MTQAAPPTSTQQIVRNLEQLRAGILALEQAEGKRTEASGLLRNQFGRMREMLGRDGEAVESYVYYIASAVIELMSYISCLALIGYR